MRAPVFVALVLACRPATPAKETTITKPSPATAAAATTPLSSECRTYDAAVDKLLACPELPADEYIEQAGRRKAIVIDHEHDAQQTRECVGATRAASEVSRRYGC